MNKIVVVKLVRLGKDGDNFSKKMIAKVERTNAKVDSDYIKEFNENWKTSGRLYIVDDELTKERDDELGVNNGAELEAAKMRYAELFGKSPHVKAKLETILSKIKEKESIKLTLDQLKAKAKVLEIEFNDEIIEEDLIKLIEEKESK